MNLRSLTGALSTVLILVLAWAFVNQNYLVGVPAVILLAVVGIVQAISTMNRN